MVTYSIEYITIWGGFLGTVRNGGADFDFVENSVRRMHRMSKNSRGKTRTALNVWDCIRKSIGNTGLCASVALGARLKVGAVLRAHV